VSFQVALSEAYGRQTAWTAVSNKSWLVVTPASGTTPSTLTLDATTTSLSIAVANATVTIDVVSPGPSDTGTSVGVSLDVVPAFAAGFDALGGPPGGMVSGIVVDPNDSQRVLVATEEWWGDEGGAQIFLSTDGGGTFAAVLIEVGVWGGPGVLLPSGRGYWALDGGGIYRTDDSGDTWSITNLQGVSTWSVAAGAADPDLVLTADGTNIWKSTNGGTDWTSQSASGGNVWAVGSDPTDSSRFFAADSVGNIYWSDGTTFTPIAIDGDPCGTNCAAVAMAVSAGGRWVVANNISEIAFTDDQGSNWSWGGVGLSGFANDLLFDTTDTLWATTWSGVFRSADGGSTFVAVSSPGVQDGGTWPMAAHPNGMLVGHEMEGLLRFDSGTSSLVKTDFMGHGIVELDYHVASGDMVGISTTGVVFLWNRVTGFTNLAVNINLSDVSLTDISIDPADPANILLAGDGGGLARTTDGGDNWVPCLGISTEFVYSISRAPEDPTVVWAGASNGLYRSTNNGVSFTAAVGGSAYDIAAVSATVAVFDAGSEVHRVALPALPVLVLNESVWLLTRAADGSIFVGDPDAGIQRSLDGGLTFDPLGLAGASPWDIEVDPNNPDRLFASFWEVSEVMMSDDGGDNWSPMGSPVMGMGLSIDPVSSTLFIGSHNAGVLTWSE